MKIRIEFTENEMKETVNFALDMCSTFEEKVELLKAFETKTASAKNDIASIEYDKEKMSVDFELDDSITVPALNLAKLIANKLKGISIDAYEKLSKFMDMFEERVGKNVIIVDGKKLGEEEEKKDETVEQNTEQSENKFETANENKENENNSEE